MSSDQNQFNLKPANAIVRDHSKGSSSYICGLKPGLCRCSFQFPNLGEREIKVIN